MSKIMCDFTVCISTCDWLISKFVSKCCLGGLGSFSRTVNITFLCFYLFQCIWCKCTKKKHRVALICDQYPMLLCPKYKNTDVTKRYWYSNIFSIALFWREHLIQWKNQFILSYVFSCIDIVKTPLYRIREALLTFVLHLRWEMRTVEGFQGGFSALPWFWKFFSLLVSLDDYYLNGSSYHIRSYFTFTRILAGFTKILFTSCSRHCSKNRFATNLLRANMMRKRKWTNLLPW